MGDDCATGVAFTRDPSTGDNRFYGEYLKNAQGEDVVAGIRTPQPLNIAAKDPANPLPSLEEEFPTCYAELVAIYKKLEGHYRDMQDIEFTIQKGRLWMLQTRNGKRTGFAAVRVAAEMLDEGLIDAKTAVLRVDPNQLTQLLLPVFDRKEKAKAIERGELLAKGLNAGPGRRHGRHRLQRRRGRAPRRGRREGAAGAHRDQPRGHPGHARRRGHPHQSRRHDQPRRRGGARHGQELRRRLRRARDRLCPRGAAGGRARVPRGRGDQHRRSHRRGAGRQHPRAAERDRAGAHRRGAAARGEPALPPVRHDHEAGRRLRPSGRAHQRRHARGRHGRAPLRRRRASACAAPSTCSSRASGSTPCAR